MNKQEAMVLLEEIKQKSPVIRQICERVEGLYKEGSIVKFIRLSIEERNTIWHAKANENWWRQLQEIVEVLSEEKFSLDQCSIGYRIHYSVDENGYGQVSRDDSGTSEAIVLRRYHYWEYEQI